MNISLKTLGAASLLLTLLWGRPCLAQETNPTPPSVPSPSATGLPWGIQVGATVSLLPFSVLSNESYQTTTSDPVSRTVDASRSTSPPVGGGMSVEVSLRGRLALQTGLLYRAASYAAGTESVFGEDEDKQTFRSSVERTRARYWDVPLLLRFYDSPDRGKGFRAFLQTGAAWRHVASIETEREQTATDGSVSRDRTPVSPRNRTIVGGVIGAGLRFAPSQRLALTPELRYTRWLDQTFDDGPTRSSRNQLELLLSLTF